LCQCDEPLGEDIRLPQDLPLAFWDDPKLDAGLKIPGRRLAVSKQGIFILAPSATAVSDVVAFIAGSEIPLMLRKIESGYSLIGQCYAHGFMGNEFWDRVDVQQETSLEEIRIG
jgi:hypothetical protein